MRHSSGMSLTQADETRIARFYTDALERFGPNDPRSVHWQNKHNQLMRFSVLLNIANLNNQEILDVGCGLGDMYEYMLERGVKTEYTGIDIIPGFIDLAQKKYPTATFKVQNASDITDMYDFIFCSGGLNFKVHDNEQYYYSLIQTMYAHARKGVAFNMLDATTHVNDDTYASYSPEQVAEFCRTFCPRVEIVVGYLPQDFTIYLTKDTRNKRTSATQ